MRLKRKFIYISILIIFIYLILSYGYGSFSKEIFTQTIYGTWEPTRSSIPFIESIISFTLILSLISNVYLFFNYCFTSRKSTFYDLAYLSIVIIMVINLFVFTKNPMDVLTNPKTWVDRMFIMSVLGSSIFFYASDEKYWVFIKKIIVVSITIMLFIVAYFFLTKGEIYSSRSHAYKYLHGFGAIIRLGIFIYLTEAKSNLSKIIGILALFIYILMIITLQARLYVVDLFLNLIIISILLIRNRKNIKNDSIKPYIYKIITIAIILSIFFTMSLFVTNISQLTILPNNIRQALSLFSERLFLDTRTEQANHFFTYFWDSFPFGVGYNTEGIHSGVGLLGIDNGYLNSMYLVGMPMMIVFMFMTITPVIKASSKKLSITDIAIVSRALSWIIILTSSATTNYYLEFIFFIIVAGRSLKFTESRRSFI